MGEGPLSQWQGRAICPPRPPCNRPGPSPFGATTGCVAVSPAEKRHRRLRLTPPPSVHQLTVKGSGLLMEPLPHIPTPPTPTPTPSVFPLFPRFFVCSGLSVGSMPIPAPPQFPGHSLPPRPPPQLWPGELGTKTPGGQRAIITPCAHPPLCPLLAWSPLWPGQGLGR